MGEILVSEKDIVVPGEIVAKGMDLVPARFLIRDGENLIATKIGIVSSRGSLVKLISLSGEYIPKKEDIIIGKVVGINFNGWRVDFGGYYSAFLTLKEGSVEYIEREEDLTRYFDFGDYIVAQVINVNENARAVDLTAKGPGLRKLGVGRIIRVAPYKVPRIIGKQGSMINLLKEQTGCKISVGQNGWVWIYGEDPIKERLCVEAIGKIERESHISGLTDRVKEFLGGTK